MTLSNTPPRGRTPEEYLGTSDLAEQLEQIATDCWRVPASIIERVCAAACTHVREYRSTTNRVFDALEQICENET